MKVFVIVASLVAVALARPDIGLKLRQQQLQLQQQGYNYQPPATSYGVPNYQDASSQFQHHRVPSGSYIPSQPNPSLQIPSVNLQENSFSGGFSSSLNGFQGLANQAGPGFNSFSSQSGSTSSTSSLHQNGHHAETQKHVYFYEAPYEPEEPQFHRQIPVAPATKSYKIIFIKAPTQAPPTAPTIPIQPQNEEKTLVYVLVKKPDEHPDIHIPAPIPTQPSKPDVFFIKYKTRKEAEDKIQGTLSGGNHEGITANVVNNGAEFVSSIKDSVTHGADASHSQGVISNIGGIGDSSLSSQFGSTSSVTHLTGDSSSGSSSISLNGGNVQSQQYGPPGASGPY